MPCLTSFTKTCIIFRFSSLRFLSSFSVSMVICNLYNHSKFEENNKNAYSTLKIATSKGKML